MKSKSPEPQFDSLLSTLAGFRYEVRRFLCFSERAAIAAGLRPQQHQLLLQVAGAPASTAVTIAYAAERLRLRHNSVVELADRSEREGLLVRVADAHDGRCVILQLTRKGKRILDHLSADHAKELNEMAPQFVRALKHVALHAGRRAGAVQP